MKKVIKGEGVRVPETQVSTGIDVGNFIFTSGQIGRDQITKILPKDFRGQTWQALRNIQLILEAAGSKMDDLVYVNIYLTDVSEYDALNEVWNEFFKDVEIPPTRATLQVSGLAGEEFFIEIRGIAYKGN